MTRTRSALSAPTRSGMLLSGLLISGLLVAALAASGGHAGQGMPPTDDPTVVQTAVPAPLAEVRARIIEGMAARGAELEEQSERRLLFKGVTPERDGYAAVYGCKSCGDPYSAYLFLLIPAAQTDAAAPPDAASQSGTMVIARHWVAVPRPDGEERRFRPQKDYDLKDIAKMLRDLAGRGAAGR